MPDISLLFVSIYAYKPQRHSPERALWAQILNSPERALWGQTLTGVCTCVSQEGQECARVGRLQGGQPQTQYQTPCLLGRSAGSHCG